MTTALITGATAGIGAAYAEFLGAKGIDLVLVARDAERLHTRALALRTEHGVRVECLPADLSDPDQRARVEQRLSDAQHPIGFLINNAGFGLRDPFDRTSMADEQRLLDVMVTATMRLCHAALPGMIDRRFGVILNVSSVASWITSGTYSAAKAWVTVFSEGLACQVAQHGVRVTAVCPGYVRTEFHERAGMDVTGVPQWLWLDPRTVVATSFRDAAAGRPISVSGPQYRVMAAALRLAPRWVIRRATGSPELIDRIRTGE
ncbi:MAG: SDR family NAD(P)-dependent oxidoreductase [Actinomycetales bacterium]